MATSGRLRSSATWELPFIYPTPEEPPVRAKRFADLGWSGGPDERAAAVVALDVGLENVCGSTFERGHDDPTSVFMPTAVRAGDPHAFRTLERNSFETGTHALAFWPQDRVLRGYNGSLQLPSQIGIVDFPADHALAGLLLKVAEARAKESSEDLVVTLPTFVPLSRLTEIRETVEAKAKRLRLFDRAIPSFVAATYFFLYPSLGGPRIRAKAAQFTEWSDAALREGRVMVFDWGASGLNFGLVELQGKQGTTELRLRTAGSWPSLGGHRLTLQIFNELKIQLTNWILSHGPADLRHRHDTTRKGDVFAPPGYDEAFEPGNRILAERLPRSPQAMKLRNVVFPTIWKFPPGTEPHGYAPLRKVAIGHFKKLWAQAETLKKTVLADPEKYADNQTISWSVESLDSPFTNHLPVKELSFSPQSFLRRVHSGLLKAIKYSDDVTIAVTRGKQVSRFAFTGMQGASKILNDTLVQFSRGGANSRPRAFSRVHVAPCAETPIELRSVVNRGAALIVRDREKVRVAHPPDVMPFAVRVCDAVGDIEIFHPGPIDELRVFQRRLHVEEGSPQYEFFAYESADGTLQGSWGAIDFSKPEEFTEADRRVIVDDRFRFGKTGEALPRFRNWVQDASEIKKCFDRVPPANGGAPSLDGHISLRHLINYEEPDSIKLSHFIESELVSTFRKKVYLLEREFDPPPARWDFVYQRYYLSRSQELIVVREWWAPHEGKLRRNKTLHVCMGSAEAQNVLGIDWGRY